MSQERWSAVDRYFEQLIVRPDAALAGALRASAEAGLPPYHVSGNHGKLLMLLAQLRGARSILEIGTLGGYSAIWLARGLAEGGRLVTLEADARHADVARKNIATAGLEGVVEILVGRAADSLARLHAENRRPFDLIFIDADKPGNPEYLSWALRLSRVGTLIVADNVVRGGAVLDENGDESVRGIRRFYEMVAAEKRLSATAIQTVGGKGYDGFLIALVVA